MMKKILFLLIIAAAVLLVPACRQVIFVPVPDLDDSETTSVTVTDFDSLKSALSSQSAKSVSLGGGYFI